MVAVAGGGGNSQSVGLSSANVGSKGAEVDGQIVDTKRKSIKSVVDILEAGFDQIAIALKTAGSHLADSVAKTIIGG